MKLKQLLEGTGGFLELTKLSGSDEEVLRHSLHAKDMGLIWKGMYVPEVILEIREWAFPKLAGVTKNRIQFETLFYSPLHKEIYAEVNNGQKPPLLQIVTCRVYYNGPKMNTTEDKPTIKEIDEYPDDPDAIDIKKIFRMINLKV
jgi:hypothetical protein